MPYAITKSKMIIPNDDLGMTGEGDIFNLISNSILTGLIEATDVFLVKNTYFQAVVEEYGYKNIDHKEFHSFTKTLLYEDKLDNEISNQLDSFRQNWIVPDLVNTFRTTIKSNDNLYEEDMKDSIYYIVSILEYNCFMNCDEDIIIYFKKIGELKTILEKMCSVSIVTIVMNEILRNIKPIKSITEFLTKNTSFRENMREGIRKVIKEIKMTFGKYILVGNIYYFLRLHSNAHGLQYLVAFYKYYSPDAALLQDGNDDLMVIAICKEVTEKAIKIIEAVKNKYHVSLSSNLLKIRNTDLSAIDDISPRIKIVKSCKCIEANCGCNGREVIRESPVSVCDTTYAMSMTSPHESRGKIVVMKKCGCPYSSVTCPHTSGSKIPSSNLSRSKTCGCTNKALDLRINTKEIRERSKSHPKHISGKKCHYETVVAKDLRECGHEVAQKCTCELKNRYAMGFSNKPQIERCEECNVIVIPAEKKSFMDKNLIRNFCTSNCMLKYKRREETSSSSSSEEDDDEELEDNEDDYYDEDND